MQKATITPRQDEHGHSVEGPPGKHEKPSPAEEREMEQQSERRVEEERTTDTTPG